MLNTEVAQNNYAICGIILYLFFLLPEIFWVSAYISWALGGSESENIGLQWEETPFLNLTSLTSSPVALTSFLINFCLPLLLKFSSFTHSLLFSPCLFHLCFDSSCGFSESCNENLTTDRKSREQLQFFGRKPELQLGKVTYFSESLDSASKNAN